VTEDLAAPPVVSFDAARTRSIGSDADALEAFYHCYYEAVVRYLTRRIDDPQDIADLTADTFLSAMRSAATFDPRRGRPLAWLLGIAHNTVRGFHRQRATDWQVNGRIAGRRLLTTDDILRLEERLDADRKAREVIELFDQLAPNDRELVELVHMNGLTPQEAARALGMLPATARLRLFRARARLRGALDAKEQDR
jgi:RNA polymerase sigma-70 factor (ECF subfamily)